VNVRRDQIVIGNAWRLRAVNIDPVIVAVIDIIGTGVSRTNVAKPNEVLGPPPAAGSFVGTVGGVCALFVRVAWKRMISAKRTNASTPKHRAFFIAWPPSVA
jgi:hypothetical protein